MSYERYVPSLCPPWLRGPNGSAFFTAIGKSMDSVKDRVRSAALQRFPGECAADMLDTLGVERKLPRGDDEGAYGAEDADYRARIADAWNRWGGTEADGGGAGTRYGMLWEMVHFGYPSAMIIQQNGRIASLDVNGDLVLADAADCINRMDLTGAATSRPGWTFEHRDNFYSTFGILIPSYLGLYADATAQANIHAAALRWKPAKMVYCGIWELNPSGGWILGYPTDTALGDVGLDLGGAQAFWYPPPDYDSTTGAVDPDGRIVIYGP